MYAKEHLSFDPRRAEQWVDEVLKIRPPAFTRDSSVVANLLWKDEQEFQEVLCYWSSRFRAILTSKLENPIDPEFENCWLEYMSAEQHIKTQLENARDRLLERIKHAEAEEEWVTNEISVWEEIVQQSAFIDLMRYHKNWFSAHRNPGGESLGLVCHGQPLRPLHPKPFPNLFVPKHRTNTML
ncbi:uncharacterized protein LACBIDRAFT_336264 [Laccaria bicolor S238N-H82]|uniref:Predicted protein n=1 Tax=Laccaria bicolor (strain S238N-H82 / ATCC MYA-4686) TaxID=486041 RepID=B0E4X3_LACBS|nr:uncharacterized protein LACBIDRAFT_336264 [Laccaria bicolor S238N-H82]EDQ98107.1 predicted protein [Laccaria bicolor S238N-H82]|eukprot:XP_001891241.1 predicted protein [Laccaria bicolor S238N-H82]